MNFKNVLKKQYNEDKMRTNILIVMYIKKQYNEDKM